MNHQRRQWIAVLLSLLLPPLGMLYVVQRGWACIYLLLYLLTRLSGMFHEADSFFVDFLPIGLRVIAAMHAYLLAERCSEDIQRPPYSRWYGMAGLVALGFVLLVGVRIFVVDITGFLNVLMLPTIPHGAHLLVWKWGFIRPSFVKDRVEEPPLLVRGDIISFQQPFAQGSFSVKRLIGLPGDTVVYRDKRLSINGQPVPMREVAEGVGSKADSSVSTWVESLMGVEYSVLVGKDTSEAMPGPSFDFPFRDQCFYDSRGLSCLVPPGHYFVLGDNRDNTVDSRNWGFLPADQVVGKVLYIFP